MCALLTSGSPDSEDESSTVSASAVGSLVDKLNSEGEEEGKDLGSSVEWNRLPEGVRPKVNEKMSHFPYLQDVVTGADRKELDEELSRERGNKRNEELPLEKQARYVRKQLLEGAKEDSRGATQVEAKVEKLDVGEESFVAAAKKLGIDFGAMMLAKLKATPEKEKPFCNVTPWTKWSACQARCVANDVDQDGLTLRTRTRTLLVGAPTSTPKNEELGVSMDQEIPPSKQHVVDDAVFKAKTAERAAAEKAKVAKSIVEGSYLILSKLKVQKDLEKDPMKMVDIDYEIEKQKRKNREATDSANAAQRIAVDTWKDVATVKVDLLTKRQDDIELSDKMNRPPYCQNPRLIETEQCQEKKYCPVDCKVSKWSAWPVCKAEDCSSNVNFQQSVRTRTRHVIRDAENGGKDCPLLKEVQSCLDESCIWKMTDKSVENLPHCAALMKSHDFQQWTQLWVDAREKEHILSQYDSKRTVVQANVEGMAMVNAVLKSLKQQSARLCHEVGIVDSHIQVPYSDPDFKTACETALSALCTKSDWPIKGPCQKLMDDGCNQLQEEMRTRILAGAKQQAQIIGGQARDVSGALVKKCRDVSHEMERLMRRMFDIAGGVDSVKEAELEVKNLEMRLLDVNRILSALYDTSVIIADKDDWACSRRGTRDIREQNFECVKRARGSEQEVVICKGDQVPRLLMHTATHNCPSKSHAFPVVLKPGQLMDHERMAEAAFAKEIFGCRCQAGSFPQDGKCCRKGEVAYSGSVNKKGEATMEVTCNCPAGMEFISFNVGSPTWRKVCRSSEVIASRKYCIDETGLNEDKFAGRVQCCQPQEGECKPVCPKNNWRNPEGFCQSALLSGCYKFSTEAYNKGDEVPCLLSVFEMAITKEECVREKANRWVKELDKDNIADGIAYCKRPQSSWKNLFRACQVDLKSDPDNARNCNSFAPTNFNIATKNPYNELKTSYFKFVSETTTTGEGGPADRFGKSLTPGKDLPYWYNTFKPQWTEADYASVRKESDIIKTKENGRKLLFDQSESDDEKDLGDAREENLPEEEDDNEEVPDAEDFPGVKADLPPMADVQQPGYGQKKLPAARTEKGEFLKRMPKDGGFLSSKGVFKMETWPTMKDELDEEGVDMDGDNLVQIGEGAEFNPVTSGKTQSVVKLTKNQILSELKAAGEEWNIAKDSKYVAPLVAGPGDSIVRKMCVPPAEQSMCFSSLASGNNLHKLGHACLAPADHAWFRLQCQKY